MLGTCPMRVYTQAYAAYHMGVGCVREPLRVRARMLIASTVGSGVGVPSARQRFILRAVLRGEPETSLRYNSTRMPITTLPGEGLEPNGSDNNK